jgi:NOL1/NOP2/sun family putative RNA methylase
MPERKGGEDTLLPERFQERMKKMLGEEYGEFLAAYDRNREYGLRVNTLKLSAAEFEQLSPFALKKIPWIPNGYYYNEGTFPSGHLYYAAGVYYLQEPSAMTPASRLPVEPGDRVLDLCAAPGGKATELAARLKGKGVLVANDISLSRSRALLHNLELFGAANILVTNETPERLAERFAGYFDKILVDAPCSGEGMFRKSPEAAADWSPEKVESCARQQRGIAESAVRMLKPGGLLLYSTCTFSGEENEGTVSWILDRFPDMELIPMEGYAGFGEGRPEWGNGREELKHCVRIWPHRMAGEGHFLALFRKAGSREQQTEETAGKLRNRGRQKRTGGMDRERKRLLEEFLSAAGPEWADRQAECRGDRAYFVPELPEDLAGIHFLRCGLLLGEFKKGRFEPSQPLAMALDGKAFRRRISWKAEEESAARYLRGETVQVGREHENGWNLVCVDDFSLGWGKVVNGVLKNKYLCTWRKK